MSNCWTVRIVVHACETIHLLTDQNKFQVPVEAVINSGAWDDSTCIGATGMLDVKLLMFLQCVEYMLLFIYFVLVNVKENFDLLKLLLHV